MTRREWIATAAMAGAPAILRSENRAPVSRIATIEHKGILIRDCGLPGETRAEHCVPAHPNGIPVSGDKWLIVYATRKFRGTDDDCSIVYQLRAGAPDGKLIREGMISKSIDDWDAFGDGKEKFIRQHGHPVAFGVPKGALIKGKPAPGANLFVVKWRVCARILDREHNALVTGAREREVTGRTQNVEWMQFRLNRAEDDIEILQPRMSLRQKEFESGEKFCSLPDSGKMNQTFVQAVPFNADCTEWADTNHFLTGKVAALKYRFHAGRGLYEWVETGPSLFEVPAFEASLVRYRDHWLVAGRQGSGRRAIAWVATEDPFRVTGKTVSPAVPAANSPLCAYNSPDGVLRVFTGDAGVSPQHKDRDPMYCWELDPDSDFRLLGSRVIYDTVAARLAIRPGAAPKVDMCKLLPHIGNTQYIVHRVSVRSINHQHADKTIPPVNAEEEAACAIYYAKVTYKDSYPSPWEFARV